MNSASVCSLNENDLLGSLIRNECCEGLFFIGNTRCDYDIISYEKPLVYTFAPFGEIGKGRSVSWGFEFIKKMNFNVVSFSLIEEENWYREEMLLSFLELLGKSTKFPEILGYGGSMGAFGVSAYSNILKIDRLLLMNPFSTLNRTLVPNETRFKKYSDDLNWETGCYDGAAANASGLVIYDPFYDLDVMQSKRYKNLKSLHLYGVGHQMPMHLSKLGVLKKLVIDFINNKVDSEWFYKSIRKRRYYPHYYKWMQSQENTHLTKRRLKIIQKNELDFRKLTCDCLSNNVNAISGKDIDFIRDLAIKLENSDFIASRILMGVALHFRPTGEFIKKKFEAYKLK